MAKAPKVAKRDTSFIGSIAVLNFATRLAILIISIIIILVVFNFKIYKPYITEYTSLVKKNEELETKIRAAKTTIAKHEKLVKYILPLGVTNDYYMKWLPHETKAAELITSITDVGVGSGVRVTNFQLDGDKIHKNSATANLNLIVDGSYLNILYFLYHLSKMERFIVINQINFSGTKSVGDSLIMTVQCSGFVLRNLNDEEQKEMLEKEELEKEKS